jgi:arylsulfatase
MEIPGFARGYENFSGKIGRTTATSEPAWPEQATAPAGAPNIIIIVVDDMGYSDIGPYGSEIPTPNLDRLADSGVVMTNYHTAPLCSPSRAALLTGLNPHRAGFGFVSNVDPGYPGMRLELGEDVLALPEILQGNGYATFALGKWHLVREADMHPGAPKNSWPCQRGFDHYYGSLEGLNSFFEPNQIIRDNSVVDVAEWPEDYYITDDLTDQAIAMIKSLRAGNATKPFFMYFAHIAMHAPLQVKDIDLAKHQGRYESGWDKLREIRFLNQLDRGLFPSGTTQAPRNTEAGYDVAEWVTLSHDEQQRFARYMEVYAAMVETVDQSTGRLMDVLEDLGELENTIIVFTSDNGASGEGGPVGSRSYLRQFPHTLEQLGWLGDTPADDELIGTRQLGVHYPRGWAQTSNTPFRFYKGQTFAGGVRVPMLVSWPQGLDARGAIRSQYAYVTDLVPTLLELSGIKPQQERYGITAKDPDGVSMADVWRSGEACSAHTEQYSEIAGHRAFYRDGWKLVSLYDRADPVDEPKWQLYNVSDDPTECHDLAGRHPGKVAEMADAWEREAWRNTVFPLVEGSGKGGDAFARHRPADAHLSAPLRIPSGTPTLERYRSLELIQYRDFTAVVELAGYEPGDEGVLISHGDLLGGYILYISGGKLHFGYNAYGDVTAVDLGTVPGGTRRIVLKATVRDPLQWDFDFLADTRILGQVERMPQMVGMAPWTGITVGADFRGPVLRDLRQRHGTFPYTGRLSAVHYIPGQIRTPQDVIKDIGLTANARTD